jgi:transposase-like protein
MSILSHARFHDEQAAFDYVEAALWPQGPICPHCGGFDRISAITPNKAKRVRIGLKFCGQCRKQFTVRMGTIFEESKLPMTKWLQAIFLMVSSKKGVSAHQLHRTLETTYKTAWFLAHRIREAMRDGELTPFGGAGGVVEADETFIWTDPDAAPSTTGTVKGFAHKLKIMALVDRDTGRSRAVVLPRYDVGEVQHILRNNLAWEARLMTDESSLYTAIGRKYAAHDTVNHSAGEYVSATDPSVHSNTIEGYFSIFKRGMKGVYQHCAKKHLHRYLAEFDFRYSNRVALGVDDQERARVALDGFRGRRLRYQGPSGRQSSADNGPQASASWSDWLTV